MEFTQLLYETTVRSKFSLNLGIFVIEQQDNLNEIFYKRKLFKRL